MFMMNDARLHSGAYIMFDMSFLNNGPFFPRTSCNFQHNFLNLPPRDKIAWLPRCCHELDSDVHLQLTTGERTIKIRNLLLLCVRMINHLNRSLGVFEI